MRPRHSLWAIPLVLCALLGQARAERNPAQTDLAGFYGDDPQADRKVRVEQIMGVYEVLPPMRHPSETIDLRGGQVQINLWVPVGRQTDKELVARAVKWLIFGRNRFSEGARGLFAEPWISEVVLVFHEVLRPEEKGRRNRKGEELKPFLAIKLDRKRFERLSLAPLTECVERGDCEAVFKNTFSAAKLDKTWTRSRRQDE